MGIGIGDCDLGIGDCDLGIGIENWDGGGIGDCDRTL